MGLVESMAGCLTVQRITFGVVEDSIARRGMISFRKWANIKWEIGQCEGLQPDVEHLVTQWSGIAEAKMLDAFGTGADCRASIRQCMRRLKGDSMPISSCRRRCTAAWLIITRSSRERDASRTRSEGSLNILRFVWFPEIARTRRCSSVAPKFWQRSGPRRRLRQSECKIDFTSLDLY